MAQISGKKVRKRVKQLERFLIKKYKKQVDVDERDWKKYEREFKRRLRKAVRVLPRMIREASKGLEFHRGKGAKPSLDIEERLNTILMSQLTGMGNRPLAYLSGLFSLLTGFDRSYKTVERLYSDREVRAALFNIWILLLKERDIDNIDSCGDATGYSLMISKHYASYINKLKKNGKSQCKKKKFVYKFVLMDLDTRMYVCYGTSLKSERKAYEKAIEMLKEIDVSIKSIRLDRYYSNKCDVKNFPDSNIYIIPKKNATLGNGFKWHETLKKFTLETMDYLKEFFKRNNSESGFASDKKMLGWRIKQKRPDRIDTALLCRCIWHNLFNL